jgi:hypothetical protein
MIRTCGLTVRRPERCAQLLEQASTGFDWALVWPPEQLAHYLANPASATLVFERDGRVQGLVNYHCLVLQGRGRTRGADGLWADDSPARSAWLLSHLQRSARARRASRDRPRCAMMPAAALVANLFLAGIRAFPRVGAFYAAHDFAVAAEELEFADDVIVGLHGACRSM